MFRLFFLLLAIAPSGCAPAVSPAPEARFVLADPAKYKTDAERERAQQLVQNDCKTKAMTTSASLEKSIASERNSLDNLDRAKAKATEMYSASFALCMNNAGYIQK